MLHQSVRREQRNSAIINMGLSAAFFILVFGMGNHALSVGAPDNLALDFLPQSAAISFFGALVPSLIMRRAAARGDLAAPGPAVGPGRIGPGRIGPGRIGGVVLAMMALGLAIGLVLMAILRILPWQEVDWFAALAMKVVYGGLLGFGVTGLALQLLFRPAMDSGKTS